MWVHLISLFPPPLFFRTFNHLCYYYLLASNTFLLVSHVLTLKYIWVMEIGMEITLTRFPLNSIFPISGGEVDCLSGDGFTLVRFLKAVTYDCGADVWVGVVRHPRRSPECYCSRRCHQMISTLPSPLFDFPVPSAIPRAWLGCVVENREFEDDKKIMLVMDLWPVCADTIFTRLSD